MRLTSALAHVCIDTLQEPVAEAAKDYFKHSKSRFGYHASQLVDVHRLPKALANKMSALLNMWLYSLDGFKGWIPEQLMTRLIRCTQALSSLSGRPSTCKSKLCPWCRAAKIVQVEGLLASSGAQGCVQMTVPVVDVARAPRTAAGALLSVKNVVLNDDSLTLKVAYFYRGCESGMAKADRQIIRDVLKYDHFIWRNQEILTRWYEATKDLNLFNRARVIGSNGV